MSDHHAAGENETIQEHPKHEQYYDNFPATIKSSYKISYKKTKYYDIIRKSKLSFSLVKYPAPYQSAQKDDDVAYESAVGRCP